MKSFTFIAICTLLATPAIDVAVARIKPCPKFVAPGEVPPEGCPSPWNFREERRDRDRDRSDTFRRRDKTDAPKRQMERQKGDPRYMQY
jgi:hypothetical protein